MAARIGTSGTSGTTGADLASGRHTGCYGHRVTSASAVASSPAPAPQGFQVHLQVFEGPFDLLLALIAKHQLDVTEVALSQVTDEFLAYTRAAGAAWDLGQTTEFLVVAATLLDLKAARLLPAAEVEDEADLALLEARAVSYTHLTLPTNREV